MSMPYPQQPAGRPAASAQPAQAPQVVPQAGAPAQPVPQGYSTAPQGFVQGYVPVPQGPVKVRVNWLFAFKGVGGVGIPRSGGGSVGGSFGG